MGELSTGKTEEEETMNQQASQPIVLRSERLAVEISQPGDVYRGTRFDWTSFITQVTLDGQHTFCTRESLKPGHGTGGMGLCSELCNEKLIGYADAQPGEAFPKLGIGLLRRPAADNYSYLRTYEIVQLFPVHLDASADKLTIEVEPIDCRGYAARLQKTLKVTGNWLEVAYRMENTGSQPIDTHEYAHNFICIDQQLMGPDYRLHLPYPIQMENVAASYRSLLPAVVRKVIPHVLIDKLIDTLLGQGLHALAIDGGDMSFRFTPKTWFFFRQAAFHQSESYQWEIKHLAKGIGLREYDDFPPARVAVWGEAHVISAEVYIDIVLQPGEVKTWSRRYEFFAGD
jgi:hypothetical protein